MALNIGGLLAGAGVVGQSMRAEEEAQRVARQNQLKIEEQNRLDMLRQQQARAPAPEAVTTGDLLGIGQQRTMDVETVAPPAPPTNGVMNPDQARAAAQKRLETTPQIAPIPGSAATIPYGQQVPNPAANQSAFQRATEMAQFNKMKVDNFNKTLQRTDLPPNVRANLEQQRDLYQQRLTLNEEVIARNQPTVDYGREGRNYVVGQQQQTQLNNYPGADATTAIRNVLGREGGLVNNPADRGGLTKFGISQAAYPKLDIANLTADQAAAIYKRDYWDAIKADQLPVPIREMAFDAAVNQGVAWTKTALEQAKGNPEVFLQLREQRYRDIVAANPSQEQFLKGWLNRIAEFRQTAATQVAAAPAAPAAGQPAQVAQAPVGSGVTPQDIQELSSPNASVAMKAFLDKDYNEAYRQWRKTPDAAESKYGMGRLLYEGLGDKPNKEKGLRLLNEAAQQGYAPATSFLARIAPPTQLAQAPTGTTTDVTAGTTGPVVPGPVASATTPGVKQTPESKNPTAFYAGNPQAITGDQQILNAQYQRIRTEAMRKFQMAQQAGLGGQAEAIRDQIVQLDTAYKDNSRLLQAMGAVYQLEFANDPRGVSAAMSFYTGMPVAFQPRSDGTYNMWVNGQKVGQPMTRGDVRDAARELFDAKYREATIAARAKFGMFKAEEGVKLQGKLAEIQANMVKDVVVKTTEGNFRLKEESLKQGWQVKPSGAGDGTIILIPPPSFGMAPYIYNGSGRTVEIDGIKVPDNSAIPITGLPSATQIAGGR